MLSPRRAHRRAAVARGSIGHRRTRCDRGRVGRPSRPPSSRHASSADRERESPSSSFVVRVHRSLALSSSAVVGLGRGSIRMYVIGPVILAPQEVIWYRAWLCEMM